MSCPKCKDAKTPYCGSCGIKIDLFVACPWCNGTNTAENSFCSSCGKKIKYEPFCYSKHAITHERMLREVLEVNTRFDDKRIKRFISNIHFYNDNQCSICGEINEVASVKYRYLYSFFEDIGFTFGEAIIQELNEPGTKKNGVEQIVGQELMSVCLVCGNVW